MSAVLLNYFTIYSCFDTAYIGSANSILLFFLENKDLTSKSNSVPKRFISTFLYKNVLMQEFPPRHISWLTWFSKGTPGEGRFRMTIHCVAFTWKWACSLDA
ncbi:hypothetical protein CEXT_442651 [Caerostris extrusa]|uniref:Uncharacterized protein n=1 Tax=Caerostris extrusa TaxID=172846 RepID=A0AAV4PH15_CAEEX|nr:hypothetical protein CEXT_442651 [Caerostris extrusa]